MKTRLAVSGERDLAVSAGICGHYPVNLGGQPAHIDHRSVIVAKGRAEVPRRRAARNRTEKVPFQIRGVVEPRWEFGPRPTPPTSSASADARGLSPRFEPR